MSAHVLDQLSAYLDNELVPGERSAVEAHLQDCAPCARHLEELAALDRQARALPAEAPEGYFDGFPARVRARIEAKPPARLPWRMPVWTLAAAAAVLLAVVTPIILRERPAPVPAAVVAPAADAKLAAELDRVEVQDQARDAGAPVPADKPALTTARPAAPLATLSPPKAKQPADRFEPEAPGRAAAKEESRMQGIEGGVVGGTLGGIGGDLEFRDEDARRKDAAAPEETTVTVAPKPAQATGFAAAPASEAVQLAEALPAPAAAPLPQAAAKTRESKAATQADAAGGKRQAEGAAANAASRAFGPEGRFSALLARKATSVAEARALREEWRAFAEKAQGALADEARVRAIEAALLAWGLSKDAADLARLRGDAAAYLQRPDAAQTARVRALLHSVGAE